MLTQGEAIDLMDDGKNNPPLNDGTWEDRAASTPLETPRAQLPTLDEIIVKAQRVVLSVTLKQILLFSACLTASWMLIGGIWRVVGLKNLLLAVLVGACFVVLRWLVRRAIRAEDQADVEARAKRIAASMPQTLDDYHARRQFNASQVTNGRKHA